MAVVAGTGIRKFVDILPPLCGVGTSNGLGQCIPLAVADTTTFGSGNDFYRIGVRDYTRKLHTDLPATKLRGYVQLDASNNPIGANQYLGPMILAQRNRPVRVLFRNLLGVGPAGNLFLPVDTTYMGAGSGPDGTPYSQNRSVIHMHGGNTPWISDGTPNQWITPTGEPSNYKKGVSFQNVPDMVGAGKLIPSASPGDGLATYYYTNQQSGRLMWYHDHSYGLTRVNVYAGEVAPYLLYDPVEESALATATVPGTLTNSPDFTHLVPLVIQDKTFVPDPTPGGQLNVQDPTWDVAHWGGKGNFWFPHVYIPNQNPSDDSGANPMGRWDYGPWFWPPQDPNTFAPGGQPYPCPTLANPGQICPGTPRPSGVPESYMDTPLVNGTAYPILHVAPAAYRFHILDGANDRYLNLSFYQAFDAGTNQMCPGTPATPPDGSFQPSTCTEVKLISATDGIAGQGPIPDPATAGPPMIQIATEGGLLPAPAIIPPGPVRYNYNRRDIVVLNIASHALFMGPAERADVIVDFSAYSGKTLILYNDAPAPVPAFDSRNDYFTGTEDQTDVGGAPTTLPGYGPNTRTVMQVVVDATAPNTVPFSLATLQAALPGIFASTQDPPIVPEMAYGAVSDTYVRIEDTSLSFGAVTALTLTDAGSGYTSAPAVTIAAPGGGGQTATATATMGGGYLSGIAITNGGSGYTAAPAVTFSGGGGSGAVATAVLAARSLASITLTSGGSGYTSAPAVVISGGGGSGAVATAKLSPSSIATITPTNGGAGYTSAPSVTITGGGGTGATAKANVTNRKVTSVMVTKPGTGFTAAPAISFTGGGGSGASAIATLAPGRLASISMTSGGTGYTSSPRITFTGGGGENATATAALSAGSIASVTLNNGGSGYSSAPAIVFTGGGGSGAAASATLVSEYIASLALTSGGSGYANDPAVSFTGGGGVGAAATTTIQSLSIQPKAIQELFSLDYGRMNATLGVELPFTNFTTQTTIPYGYVDPPTEIFKDGETQLWKVTHNGVDTHAIHFHLFNVQLVNRVGWDGAIRPPEANELGWKDTVRMNPLEDAIVALRPVKMNVPFQVPNSIRYLDVTMAPNMTSSTMFTNVDPSGQANPVTNTLVNFGWEYVWHCHLLGHEENDMMRPMIMAVAPDAPSQLTAVVGSGKVTLTWKDNAYNETGFTVQRATDPAGVWLDLAAVPASSGTGSTVTYVDRQVIHLTKYYYRIVANNLVGYTYTTGYPQTSADSAPSATAFATP